MTLATVAFFAGVVVGYLICHIAHYMHRANGPDYEPTDPTQEP